MYTLSVHTLCQSAATLDTSARFLPECEGQGRCHSSSLSSRNHRLGAQTGPCGYYVCLLRGRSHLGPSALRPGPALGGRRDRRGRQLACRRGREPRRQVRPNNPV